MDDTDKILMGEKIASAFQLKKVGDKYVTSYGDKTALGIYYMFLHIYNTIPFLYKEIKNENL